MADLGSCPIIAQQKFIIVDHSDTDACSYEDPDDIARFAASSQPFFSERSQISVIS